MTATIFSKKNVAIFGSTGSIGEHTLKIIEQNLDEFYPRVLTAFNNFEKLIQQAKKFNPEYVCIGNDNYYSKVKEALEGLPIKVYAGTQGLIEVAEVKNDIVIAGITGIAGLPPTLAAIKNSDVLGLANKESLVCAGQLFIEECKKHNTKIIPVDSEHNSLFQILSGDKNINEVTKVTITASGGPFLRKDLSEFAEIKLADALNHPNWSMGNKITVDSATMVNKALEVIEAYYLFPKVKNNIEVVVHPESIVHAIAHYVDGSVKALLAAHDMRVPIAYVLGYPKRIRQEELSLDITQINTLTFEQPDLSKFRVLAMVRDVIAEGKALPIVFNAANEIFVNLFLNEIINFVDIVTNIESVLNNFANLEVENLEHIFEIDREARSQANKLVA